MHKYAASSWHHGKRYFSSNFSRRKMFSSMLVWVFCGFSHYTVTCGRSISRPKTSKEQQKCRFISDFWKFCCCSCQGSHSFIKVKTKTDYIHTTWGALLGTTYYVLTKSAGKLPYLLNDECKSSPFEKKPHHITLKSTKWVGM